MFISLGEPPPIEKDKKVSVSKSLAIEITNEIEESVKAILAKHNLQLLKQSTKYGAN
jgi:hypothetical protein